MDDNILNKIYGKPIDIHVRQDHGETETIQRELVHDNDQNTGFESETSAMSQKHE